MIWMLFGEFLEIREKNGGKILLRGLQLVLVFFPCVKERQERERGGHCLGIGLVRV